MATMSFMDDVKDKASRLIPSAYTEIMEETTSEEQLSPNISNIMFICDSANSNPENVTDVVRAVRRRIDNSSPKVQLFTLQVLDSLVKNCGVNVHTEIAETKGLLHDVFKIATSKSAGNSAGLARNAALLLVLNWSLWFSGRNEDRLRPLMELADHVRRATSATVFEGIEPDLSVQLRRSVAPQAAARSGRNAGASVRQRRQESEFLRLQQEWAMSASQNQRPQTVRAIPLIIPTDEEISGMLDACLVLAECLNSADTQGSAIIGDDVIANVATQIRRDHRNLAMILSSGAEIPAMDVLFSVTDSQTSIIQRLSDLVKAERAKSGGPQHAAQDQTHQDYNAVQQQRPQQQEVPQQQSLPTTTTAVSQQQQHRPHPMIRQANDIEDYEDVEMQVTPKLPPTTSSTSSSTIPTMDDLFGGGGPTASPPAPGQQQQPPRAAPTATTSAFPAPSQSVDHQTAPTAEMTSQDDRQAPAHMSLNADEGDEFDNFLNSRLRK